jgi:hypothetical protein
MLVVEMGFVSITLFLGFLPFLLGGLAYPVGVMAIIYFTAYVAPAVVLDGMTGRDALRTSFRAAMIVNTKHAILVGGYVVFVILIFFGPGAPGVATPSIVVWLFALVAGLLHVCMQSVFVHRWRALSPAVLPGKEAAGRASREAPVDG